MTGLGDAEGTGKSPVIWSKSKKKRMRAKKARRPKEQFQTPTTTNDESPAHKRPRLGAESGYDASQKRTSSTAPGPSSSSALQNKFRSQLAASRFRMLNEELYTTTSQASWARLQADPNLFDQYHTGFRQQVEQWPDNPVHVIAQLILGQHPANVKKPIVVADFGCGDAELAQTLLKATRVAASSSTTSPVYQVHSFDFVNNNNPFVTACDMAHVPLLHNSVDVGVFCLALMGTNLADFIREAHRVMKPSSRLYVAEVRSRFEDSRPNRSGRKHNRKGGQSTKQSQSQPDDKLLDFIQMLDKLGFRVVRQDRSNKMFVLLQLEKNGKKPDKKLAYTARPCIYKRR